MSDLFLKASHLNRMKINMGLSIFNGHSNTNAYICEQKLKKIIKSRVDEQIWQRFRAKRKYVPTWMVTFDRFLAKLVWYIEKDRNVDKSLAFFEQRGILALVTKYVDKRKNKIK